MLSCYAFFITIILANTVFFDSFKRNMSAKPFRNSKGVNKPFRSPFAITPESSNNRHNSNTPQSNSKETPLRVIASKRSLFQQTPSPKKLCINKGNDENPVNEKQKKISRDELESLRKRVQKKQECINKLTTSLLYRKKNSAEDLQNAIQKWRNACQLALRDYQNDLQEKKGQSVTISDILFSLNIDPTIVQYSIDDDTFY